MQALSHAPQYLADYFAGPGAASLALDATGLPTPEVQRRYRIEIPNIIDDLGLSVHAYRLYGHIKRVTGAFGGKCTQNTATLAKACCMSRGSVTKAKAELLAMKLITIESGDPVAQTSDTVRIVNIWPANYAFYLRLAAQKKAEKDAEKGAKKVAPVRRVATSRPPIGPKKETPSESPQPLDKNTSTNTTDDLPLPNELPVSGDVVVSMATPENAERRLPLGEYILLVQAMGEIVGENSAKRLIRECTAQVCRQQLEWLPHRAPPTKDRAGYYASFCRRNDPEPASLREAREKAAQEAKQQRCESERQQDEKRRAQGYKKALAEWHDSQTPMVREQIERIAQKRARVTPHFDSMPESAKERSLRFIRARVAQEWRDGKHYE